jgi:hypothetical protein
VVAPDNVIVVTAISRTDGNNPKSGPLADWRREKVVFACNSTVPEQRLSDAGNQTLVLTASKGAGGDLMIRRNDGRPEHFADNARMVAGAALPEGGAVVIGNPPRAGRSRFLPIRCRM